MTQADLIGKAFTMLRTEKAMRDWCQAAEPLLRHDPGDAWYKAAGIVRRDPTDATIGSGNFTQGIPAFWFARALDPLMLEQLYTPYRDSAWVRRAIKFVSGPISSVDLVFTKPKLDASLRRHKGRGPRLFTSRGIVRREPDNEIELPQIRQWLREPMEELTYEDFVEASLGWYMLNECFWLLGDDLNVPFPEASKRPFQPIIVARPDRMRPVLEDGKIAAWEFTDYSGKTWALDKEQVVRLFGWNPYDPHRGLGDYPSAAIAAESHWLGGKFKRALTADNDTAPIINAKNGTPSDAQIDQIKMQILERRSAKQRGMSKTLFLPAEIDVHDPKILSVDAGFISSMLEDRHEIFMAFGVPPSLADVKASYSIGQASDWFALIFNTCIPVGGKFCAVLEKLILKLTGQQVEVALDWDEHYVMQQVRSERMKDADSLFAKGMPMKDISDHLRLGLPRFDNDDIGYIPINITPTQSEEEMAETAPKPEDYSEQPGPKPGEAEPPKEVQEMMRALAARGDAGPTVRSPKTEALWKAHMRIRTKAIKLFQSKSSKVFNAYRIAALRKLEQAKKAVESRGSRVEGKSLVDVIFDPKLFGLDLFKALEPVMRATLAMSGKELFEEIGQPDDPWQMAPGKVLSFVSSREALVKRVGETAQSQLNTALQEGLEKGETTEQLSDRVRGVFNNLSKYEAKRIAMTETNVAYNFSRQEAMTDAGIEYKAWLSSHGPNVRDAHAQAEDDYIDDPIPIDEPFEVGGEELMYPGDPAGSPENVINCQCIQLAADKQDEDEKSVTYLVHGAGEMTFRKKEVA